MDETEKAIVAKTAIAVTSGVAAILLKLSPYEAAPILAIVGGSMLNILSQGVDLRKHHRTPLTARGYLSGAKNKSLDDVRKELEEKISDERAQSSVIETFQRVMNALDDAVVPYLGRLLYEYEAKRVSKRFFRDFGRVLAELEIEDLFALRTLLDGPAKDAGDGGEWITLRSEHVPDSASAFRMIVLLKNNQLAHDEDTWGGELNDGSVRTTAGVLRANAEAMRLVVGEEITGAR